ncbi:hypothetical protein A2Y85_00575 [candidate division WOR-3 bacterium RBG_13_43_14]|uniref:DUF1343 domain-containing protein n=1 Tax=candidate division WOR-3 bacterium RBG_13_43_14 TaxID=1802590 RepID=A0A1F4UER1_UNCW3|nr:MAG: hypothetical protein A2Y85_00575 [candidate division WOR-3 bacterium RBG_13_43_14]
MSIQLGIDVLKRRNFRQLRGYRIGLCTNLSCCDSDLITTYENFKEELNLQVIFAPEHGLYTDLQDQIPMRSYVDRKNRIKIISLYDGKKLTADPEILKKIDILVVDLFDIGSRYYTFLWTAMLLMQQISQTNKKVIVLDRPNPINGIKVEGPVLLPQLRSFVGLYLLPIRHGMTIGELLTMINSEAGINADLEIIKMRNWKRAMYYDETGLSWTIPSPNMPVLSTAIVYPGMCLLEGTNLSEGRGTTRPFEIFGAPWIEPFELIKNLSAKLTGVKFRPLYFTPTFHKHNGKTCGGLQIYVTDRNKYRPIETTLELLRVIKKLFPGNFSWRKPPYEFERKRMPFDILIGNTWVRKMIDRHRSIPEIKCKWTPELERFRKLRKQYLLYK